VSAGPDAAALTALFAGLGPVRVRRMFGGAGVYLDDAMFAMVADGIIYLRTDPDLAAALEAEGAAPFVYSGGKGAPVERPYWRLPDAALDDPEAATAWARRALVPARAAAAKRAAARARKAARPRA
jgi:DNA transformation protein